MEYEKPEKIFNDTPIHVWERIILKRGYIDKRELIRILIIWKIYNPSLKKKFINLKKNKKMYLKFYENMEERYKLCLKNNGLNIVYWW